MCENREILRQRRGAFAEYAVLPERALCHLPAKLSLEEGGVIENLGIAMHSVDIEQHDPGDWAVIIGAGPIGILAAEILRSGASIRSSPTWPTRGWPSPASTPTARS